MFDGDRFFTGDIGFMDEKGRLHLTGRKKDVVPRTRTGKLRRYELQEEIGE